MTSMTSNSVIQCNTTAQVMCCISPQRAIAMIVSGTAVSIQDTDEVVRSQHMSIPVPRIIMLTQYVDEYAIHNSLKVHEHLRNTPSRSERYKRLILQRDNYTCAYCGGYGNTIDHIIPQSRGGSWEWDNVIAACHSCNSKKEDFLLTELGWTMLFQPRPLSESRYEKEQQLVFSALESIQTA